MCAFSSEKYWVKDNNSSSSININNYTGNKDGDAMTIAQKYAKNIGGDSAKARLLTLEEAEKLKTNYENIVYGTNNNYWLADTYEDYDYSIHYVDVSHKNITINSYRINDMCGVRPVITVSKSLL